MVNATIYKELFDYEYEEMLEGQLVTIKRFKPTNRATLETLRMIQEGVFELERRTNREITDYEQY